MRKSTFLGVFIIILISIIFIGENNVKVSASVMNDKVDTKKIDDYVNLKMRDEKIQGASLAIVKDNQIVYLKGYGKSDNNESVTPQTPFFMGSLSKSFTGLAIAQLVQEGKIDLNSPVQKYLPWFTLKDTEVSKEITIKNLICHSSGISGKDGTEALVNDDMPIEQFVKNLKNIPITYNVNTKFEYSNINYQILGEIVQKVSGMSYQEYIEKNIFKPLEMNHSYTNREKAKEDGLATGYKSLFGFMVPINDSSSHEASLPAAFLIASGEDLAHYMIAQINGGKYNGSSVISENGMEMTQEPISSLSNYGMGWFVNDDSIGHGGDTDNFHGDINILKEGNWGVAILFNSNDYGYSALLGTPAYRDISQGVIKIIQDQEPENTSNINNKVNLFHNILGIVAVSYIIILLLTLVKYNKRINKRSLKRRIILVNVINILIPLVLLTTLFGLSSRIIGYSEKFLLNFLPDIFILQLIILGTPIMVGIIKLIYIRRDINKANRSEIANF